MFDKPSNLPQGLRESINLGHMLTPSTKDQKFVHINMTQLTSNISMSSSKKEREYKKFQGSILNRTWLPISRELTRRLTNNSNKKKYNMIALTSTPIDDIGIDHDKLSPSTVKGVNTPTYSKSMTFPDVPPTPKSSSSSSSGDNHIKKKTRTISMYEFEKLFDYAKHLYFKYVNESANLSVNVKSQTRTYLSHIFTIQFNNFLNYVEKLKDKDEDTKYLSGEDYILSFFLSVYDQAFDEIWNLTNVDSFLRFKDTPQYAMLNDQ